MVFESQQTTKAPGISIVACFTFILAAQTAQAFSPPRMPSAMTTRNAGLRKRQMLGDYMAQTKKMTNAVFPLCLLPGCCPPPPAPLLYCSAVTDSSDSESEASLERNSPATTTISWKEKLVGFSNFASFLCVLDCTVLPALTLLLPLFGIVASSPAQMEWMHELGHAVALYFVMPVGLMATTTNYLYNHRKLWITAIGWMGLTLILASNAGCSLLHVVSGHHHNLLHRVLHLVSHGVAHRVANLTGCALLITSNLISRRRGCSHHGPSCDHKH